MRIKIPLKRVEDEEEVFSQELGETVRQKVEKLVEVDFDDKGLAVASTNENVAYSIYTLNQAAARVHRKEVFHLMKKNFGEYFDTKDPQKDIDPIVKRMEELADKIDDKYV